MRVASLAFGVILLRPVLSPAHITFYSDKMVNTLTTLATVALASLAAAAPVLPRADCVSGLYMIVARGTNEAAGMDF